MLCVIVALGVLWLPCRRCKLRREIYKKHRDASCLDRLATDFRRNRNGLSQKGCPAITFRCMVYRDFPCGESESFFRRQRSVEGVAERRINTCDWKRIHSTVLRLAGVIDKSGIGFWPPACLQLRRHRRFRKRAMRKCPGIGYIPDCYSQRIEIANNSLRREVWAFIGIFLPYSRHQGTPAGVVTSTTRGGIPPAYDPISYFPNRRKPV